MIIRTRPLPLPCSAVSHLLVRLTFGHGAQLGDFTLAGMTYFFRAPQESSENHLANISTRGFVHTGQGQLIGGFIITGGPKLVLVRALGPSLAAQGVSPALDNPVLKLMSGGYGASVPTMTGRVRRTLTISSRPRSRRSTRVSQAFWCASNRGLTRPWLPGRMTPPASP